LNSKSYKFKNSYKEEKMSDLTGWKKYGLLGVSGLLTLAFLAAGATKLAGMEVYIQNYQKWGIPLFFLYVVGASEVIFAIGLWIRRFSGVAALGLVFLMIGAVGTHVKAGEMNALMIPIGLGVLALFVFWLRWPETRDRYLSFGKTALQKN
jgi:putative oxidoreductase